MMVFVSLGEAFKMSSLHLLNCSYLDLKLFTLYLLLFSALSPWEEGKSEKLLGYCPESTHHSREFVDD